MCSQLLRHYGHWRRERHRNPRELPHQPFGGARRGARGVLGHLRFNLVLGHIDISDVSHRAAEETAQRPGAAPEKARDQNIIIRVVVEVEDQAMGQLPVSGFHCDPGVRG